MRRNGPTELAAWLRNQLTQRGYDLSTRGGGQKAFAERSGISRSTISRMLSGDAESTDIRVLEKLAEALGVPLPAVLVAAGVLTAEEVGGVQAPAARMTPDQAADALGIPADPQTRSIFANFVNSLKPGNGAR
ncbi:MULTISPECIES: helix-turn-helix domain-containing protein [unclassified Streptomyces]|uniref:helix-turn-helix domain-containing protein n=1 Tax=unclassified Streptomyces TaxID=2593676 RepID=UPI00339A1B32